jgi:hypothetical protein
MNEAVNFTKNNQNTFQKENFMSMNAAKKSKTIGKLWSHPDCPEELFFGYIEHNGTKLNVAYDKSVFYDAERNEISSKVTEKLSQNPNVGKFWLSQIKLPSGEFLKIAIFKNSYHYYNSQSYVYVIQEQREGYGSDNKTLSQNELTELLNLLKSRKTNETNVV